MEVAVKTVGQEVTVSRKRIVVSAGRIEKGKSKRKECERWRMSAKNEDGKVATKNNEKKEGLKKKKKKKENEVVPNWNKWRY